MKKIGLFLIGLFFIAGHLLGQEGENSLQENGTTKLENSLLWEISGNELEKPSYLYGTIHLISKKDFFFTEATKAAMNKAEHFTFEIDMNEMSDISKIMPVLMRAFMKGDTTLADLLSKEDYQLVNEHFKKVGIPLMLVERIKPMFLSMLGEGGGDAFNPFAEQSEDEGEEKADDMLSYEFEIMEIAEKNKKTVGGLETMEFQMSIFDRIPYSAQAEMLVETIKIGEDTSTLDQFGQMVEIYKMQDISAMDDMMDDEGGIAGYEDILLDDRNKKWIPIMEKLMNQKVTFFAVGAGHLAGDNGVIELLRNQGYTLKPLY